MTGMISYQLRAYQSTFKLCLISECSQGLKILMAIATPIMVDVIMRARIVSSGRNPYGLKSWTYTSSRSASFTNNLKMCQIRSLTTILSTWVMRCSELRLILDPLSFKCKHDLIKLWLENDLCLKILKTAYYRVHLCIQEHKLLILWILCFRLIRTWISKLLPRPSGVIHAKVTILVSQILLDCCSLQIKGSKCQGELYECFQSLGIPLNTWTFTQHYLT